MGRKLGPDAFSYSIEVLFARQGRRELGTYGCLASPMVNLPAPHSALPLSQMKTSIFSHNTPSCYFVIISGGKSFAAGLSAFRNLSYAYQGEKVVIFDCQRASKHDQIPYAYEFNVVEPRSKFVRVFAK